MTVPAHDRLTARMCRSALLLLSVTGAACATAGRVYSSPLPHRFLTALPLDSARALVGEAITREGLPRDGSPDVTSNTIVSTFVVRKGGMGEGEVRLSLRLSRDAAGDSLSSGVLLELDATIRDTRRMMLMSPEDARNPRLGREPHPVQENDRDTLGRIRKLEDRLQQLGFAQVEPR